MVKKKKTVSHLLSSYFFIFQDYTFDFETKTNHYEEDRVGLGGGVEKKMRDRGGEMENGERGSTVREKTAVEKKMIMTE